MSNDDTKDLTFNQLYAGRSRTRRDLNTLKTQLVVAHHTSVADNGTGITKYSLSPNLGGVHKTQHLLRFGAGKFLGCGPLANTLSMTDSVLLGQTELSIPIWRGTGDFPGRTVRGKSQFDLGSDSNSYSILGAEMFLFQPFTGVTTAQVSLGVSNYNRLALINGQSTGGDATEHFADMCLVGHAYKAFPQAESISFQAGEILRWGVFPGWTHNQDVATDASASGIEHGAGNPTTAANANYPGVHLNIKVTGGGKNVDDISGGILLVSLWYSIDPA